MEELLAVAAAAQNAKKTPSAARFLSHGWTPAVALEWLQIAMNSKLGSLALYNLLREAKRKIYPTFFIL